MNVFGAHHPLRNYRPGGDLEQITPLEAVAQTLDDLGPNAYAETLRQLSLLAVEGYDPTAADVIAHATFEADRKLRRDGVRPTTFEANVHAAPTGSLVYYMQIRDTIKIGFTTQPLEKRRAQLMADRILAAEPGDAVTEALRHRQFKHLRITHLGNERFHIVPELLDHIAHIRRALPGIQPAGVAA